LKTTNDEDTKGAICKPVRDVSLPLANVSMETYSEVCPSLSVAVAIHYLPCGPIIPITYLRSGAKAT